VAEAASIGGLGDGPADIYVEIPSNGTLNVFSNGKQQKKTNGYPQPTNNLTDEELALKNGSGTSSSSSSSDGDSTTSPVESVPVSARKPKEFDVIRGDVPAANAFVEPLPFKLPKLSAEQKQKLIKGERIQEQSRMGREGSGFVVLDVKAPAYVVWECLLDFESYPQIIPTVKSMQLYTSEKLSIGFVNEKAVMPGTGRETRHYGTPSVTRAAFTLSKFRLNIAAIHRYTPHPLGDYMEFTLDKSCTNMVLKGAKGIWYTEANPDGREVRKHRILIFSFLLYYSYSIVCTTIMSQKYLHRLSTIFFIFFGISSFKGLHACLFVSLATNITGTPHVHRRLCCRSSHAEGNDLVET
jgi:hypothetical protein